MRHLIGAALLLAAGIAVGTHDAGADIARTWYVRAGATGAGSQARPFGSLTAVERVSGPGDTIVVLPAEGPLTDGIALKPRQSLLGAGPAVTTLPASAPAPTLTSASRTMLDGDAVRLADGATVRNVRIAGTARGAIYGRDVTAVTVSGNDVSGQNAACAKGYLIPGFNLPTNLPGVGVPLPGGLQNGWAGIELDASRRTGITATVTGNHLHDARCGDGIDVRLWGSATGAVTIDGNRVERLQQGPAFLSLLAIGLQAREHADLHADVRDNIEADLGNPGGPNLGPAGADSEGVFVNAAGPAHIRADIDGNTYTNRRHLGGFSANGLEAVTMGNGGSLDVSVRHSSLTGPPGDVIEEGALGTDAHLHMLLDHVLAADSAGIGETLVLPFNNGDCLIAGSLGAGNDVHLTVAHSTLRNCRGNGLSIGSNVVNGHGPTRAISVAVTDSAITGNRGANLGIRNFTGLTRMAVAVQHTDLAGARGVGTAQAELAAEDVGTTGSAAIDLGAGTLGSAGGNCLGRGPALTAELVRYGAVARHDWWTAPRPRKVLVLDAGFDAAQPLTSAPPYC